MLTIKFIRGLKWLCQSNYYISLIITLLLAVLLMSGDDELININPGLYGPLAYNLIIMLVYIFISELCILYYCLIKNNYKAVFIVGLFLLLIIPSLQFYGKINHILIDQNLFYVFIYTGFSHICYGAWSFFSWNKTAELENYP